MLEVKIRTGNAAFDPPEMEAARILRVIADRIERGEATGKFQTVMDLNGNDVGRFKLAPEVEE